MSCISFRHDIWDAYAISNYDDIAYVITSIANTIKDDCANVVDFNLCNGLFDDVINPLMRFEFYLFCLYDNDDSDNLIVDPLMQHRFPSFSYNDDDDDYFDDDDDD